MTRDTEPYPPWDMPSPRDIALDREPEPVTPKQPIVPCDTCDHLLCLIQRRIQEWVA